MLNFQSCNLCPRQCKVDRTAGQLGFCGASHITKVARSALHRGEEPCISGENGSGTVFFSHCTLHCVFCQNAAISFDHFGIEVSEEQLCDLFLNLQSQGAHNINLVTATHYLPTVKQALILAKKQGLKLPVVYNCGGYERAEVLQELRGLIDVYLPDFKYFDQQLAMECANCKDYANTAFSAIDEMLLQVGLPSFDQNGLMSKGVLVRHLLLPGSLDDSKHIVSALFERYKHQIYLSLMNQYTPMPAVKDHPNLSRRVFASEYNSLVDFAIEIGIEQGFIQEDAAGECYIPLFDGEGVNNL